MQIQRGDAFDIEQYLAPALSGNLVGQFLDRDTGAEATAGLFDGELFHREIHCALEQQLNQAMLRRRLEDRHGHGLGIGR